MIKFITVGDIIMNNLLKKIYDQDIKTINEFLKNRPEVIACYCVEIVKNYNRKAYKLILVVPDIWDWQQQNNNPKENTIYTNLLYHSGYKNIQYVGINESQSIFDYILIDREEFENNLQNWNNYTFAQLFQKPFLTIKSSKELTKSILINQRNALTTSIFLTHETQPSLFNLFLSLYTITDYPNINNVSEVNIHYDTLKRMYTKFNCFQIDRSSHLIIDYIKAKNNITYLPNSIQEKIFFEKQYIFMDEVKRYLEQKVAQEQQDEEYVRLLSNGLLKTLSYNSRKNKTH